MTTHLTDPKQVVDAYMEGVPDEQFRAETLYKDWDGWEGPPSRSSAVSPVGTPSATCAMAATPSPKTVSPAYWRSGMVDQAERRQNPFPGPVWTTKSGEEIPVTQLDDDHILLSLADRRIQEIMNPDELGMRPRQAARLKWPALKDVEREAVRRSL